MPKKQKNKIKKKTEKLKKKVKLFSEKSKKSAKRVKRIAKIKKVAKKPLNKKPSLKNKKKVKSIKSRKVKIENKIFQIFKKESKIEKPKLLNLSSRSERSVSEKSVFQSEDEGRRENKFFEKTTLPKTGGEDLPIEAPLEEKEEAKQIYISPHLINLKEMAEEKEALAADDLKQTKPKKIRKISFKKINFIRKIHSQPRFAFVFNRNLAVELAIFLTVSFVLVSTFFSFIFFQNLKEGLFKTRGKVLGEASTAIEHLLSGSQELLKYNPKGASYQFSQADEYFSKAGGELEGINNLIKETSKIIPYDQGALESADSLIEAGRNITLAASYLSEILNVINRPDKDFGYENREAIVINNESLVTNHLQKNFYHKLEDLNLNLTLAADRLAIANSNLAAVKSEVVPEDRKEDFLRVREQIAEIEDKFFKLSEFTEAWLDILGRKELKRYLAIFQNNNELRATGGFMGSFALITIDRGLIKKVEFPEGGSYDIQGQLLERVKPPPPLNLINSRWYFHDANWWPDFPTTAQKLIWFYEKSGGPTPDGVMAITADIMKDLLQFTGAIEVSGYHKTITAENFYEETQRAVELEYDKEANRPKKFIVALAFEFFKKFAQEEKNFQNFFRLLDKNFSQKTIQFYFTDEKIEKIFTDFNLTGQIKNPTGDYLAIINTNLRGGKTDNFIKEKFYLETEIDDAGQIVNKLTIERTHTGDPNNFFEKTINLDYLRIYAPKGAKLLSASGFNPPDPKSYYPEDETLAIDADLARLENEAAVDPASGTKIYDQFGKTVFANWIQTAPNETAKITLTYQLPFILNKRSEKEEKNYYDLILEKLLGKETVYLQEDFRNYTLLNQKQAGDNNLVFSHKINLPNNWRLVWQNKEPSRDLNLLQDDFYGAIYQVK